MERDGKNAVTFEDYKADNFPSFCGGLAYILTVPAIRKLVAASLSTKSSDFLWLDDVFITGILAIKAGVPLISIEVSREN